MDPTAFSRYQIDAMVDIGNLEIRAQAFIAIHSIEKSNGRSLVLDGMSAGKNQEGVPRLQVTSVLDETGRALEYWMSSDGGRITVQLNESIRELQVIKIHIGYRVDLTGMGTAENDFGYLAFPCYESGGFWYPNVIGNSERQLQFHDFDVTLTYPKGFGVLTSGWQAGQVREGANELSCRFVANHVEGFAVNIGKGFKVCEKERGDIHVVAFYPDRLEQVFLHAADLALEIADWYRKVYGFFPAKQIGFAPGHPKWSGGFPSSNLFYLHLGRLDPDYVRFIVAHELGHYYWGLYALSASERQLDWLMLANGIWIEQLFLARKNKRELPEQWRQIGEGDWMLKYLTAMVANREQRLGISVAEERKLQFDYNSYVRHAKGAVGLYLQALRIGEKKFVSLQKDILAAYKYKSLSVRDFCTRMEEVGADGACAFFKKWARGDATVGYSVESSKAVAIEDEWKHSITMWRSGAVQVPFDMEVRGSSSSMVKRTLAGEQKEVVDVRMKEPRAKILLDPDGKLPMWNSASLDIHRLFLLALYRAGLEIPFLNMARQHLSAYPVDEEVRSKVAAQHFKLGEYNRVIALFENSKPLSCDRLSSCISGYYLARAWARLGKCQASKSFLQTVKKGFMHFNLQHLWQKAHDEVQDANPCVPKRRSQ
jgi:hypothetical protein